MRELDREVVKLGLAQIPRDGLERLAAWIDAGKPVALDGSIISVDGYG